MGDLGQGLTVGLCLLPLQDTLAITSTFKLVKSHLAREGFNVDIIADPLFVLDNQSKAFQPLTVDMYQAICSGTRRL